MVTRGFAGHIGMLSIRVDATDVLATVLERVTPYQSSSFESVDDSRNWRTFYRANAQMSQPSISGCCAQCSEVGTAHACLRRRVRLAQERSHTNECAHASSRVKISRKAGISDLYQHSVLVEGMLRCRRLGAELVVNLSLLRVHQNLPSRINS